MKSIVFSIKALISKFRPALLISSFAVLVVSLTSFSPNEIHYMRGVEFQVDVIDHRHSPAETSTMAALMAGRNLKIDILPSEDGRGSGEMIYRGDKREMIVTDDDEKAYYVFDEAAINKIKGQVQDTRSMMDNMMKNLTKEQREMLEKAQKDAGGSMPGMGPMIPKREVKRTGERAERNGYPCVRYDVLENDIKKEELWYTDWSNIEGGDIAKDAYSDMYDFYKEMLESLGDDFGDMNVLGEMDPKLGFPVVTRGFDDFGGLEDEGTLRSARRRTLDPDAFEPPSGYKRRSMFPN